MLVITFVPIIVTLMTISRYVTGFKTFGIYTPMILAFAYYYMGGRQAVAITTVVIFFAWLTRSILKRVRLHYFTRLAVIYSVISLAVLAFILATSYIPSENPVFDFRYLQPVPLVMIISVTDRFVSNLIKKDIVMSIRLTVETMLVAMIGWGLMRWEISRELLMSNTIWIVPLVIFFNLLLANYSGLRWTELSKFSHVLKGAGDTKKPEKK